MLNAESIEDLLELFASMHSSEVSIKPNSSDVTIMYSIARATFKGTALTDRQFALMQTKLETYRDQFENQGVDFSSCIGVTRQPLREIDRRKFIKMLSAEQVEKLRIDDTTDWFVIRFPFKKTHICLLQQFHTDTNEYAHNKGSHEHFFKFSEKNVYAVLSRFIDKNFEIDEGILDYYKQIKDIKQQGPDYLNILHSDNVTFSNTKAKQFAENEIGELNDDNYLKYLDRRWRYGIDIADVHNPKQDDLVNVICCRKSANIHIPTNTWTIDDLFSAINTLDRFPLLCVLGGGQQSLEQLHTVYQATKGFLLPQEQSVLFRYDNPSEFNDYVKEKNLNNWVDKNTKVVYINNEKLPKLLLKGEWTPVAVLQFSEHRNRTILSYTHHNCDLVMCYAEEVDMMRRYSKFYDGQL